MVSGLVLSSAPEGTKVEERRRLHTDFHGPFRREIHHSSLFREVSRRIFPCGKTSPGKILFDNKREIVDPDQRSFFAAAKVLRRPQGNRKWSLFYFPGLKIGIN